MNKIHSKKGMKIIGIIFVIFALLVAPHEGEFWPFSIYPMFSKAGNPWTRAMVTDVTGYEDNMIWEVHSLENLRGEPVPVSQYGVDQIDYSNFISKTQNWTERRRLALIRMFGAENIGERQWMASKVHGKMVGEDSVTVEVQPFLLFTADTVYMNPNLDEEDYFSGGSR